MKMDKYIDEFKAVLQTGRPIIIEGVGQLQANTIGIVSFTSENMPITWETLHVKPVIRSDASHKITVGDKEIVGTQVTNHLTASPDHTTTTHDYPDFPESDSRFRWWWVLAPVGAILLAGLVWWLAEQQDKNAIIANASKEAVDTLAQQEALKPDTLTQVITPPVVDTIEYYAVIETFHDRNKAEKKYAKRKDAFGQKEVQLLYTASDSTLFKIAVPLRSLSADTTKMKDSIAFKYKTKVFLQF
jgi:hypothetical protein